MGRLRTLLVGLLVGIGCLSLIAFIGVHWTERQVLNTNNWVEMVAPLPQNPVVASALSNYAVDQLYSAVDVTQVIKDALPEKAQFLAAPLSNQLKVLAISTGQTVVVSDQFNQVWVAANRTAIGGLVAVGRSNPAQPPAGTTVKVGKVSLNLNINQLNKLLTEKLGTTGDGVFTNITKQLNTIQVGLKSTANQIRDYFKLIDYANAILPYLAISTLIAAVAIAKKRRSVVLAASVTVIVLTLLQLIGLHSLRPAILNAVQNSSYRPAVSVIYSAVVHSFNDMVGIVLVASTIVYLSVALLTGKGRIATMVVGWAVWTKLQKSSLAAYTRQGRKLIAEYRYQIWGVGALFSLVALAFWIKVDMTTITQVVLGYIAFISVIQLLVPRQAN